jgi:hypothetical protein
VDSKLNEKMRAHGLNSHEVATIWARPECRNIIFNFNDANHPTDVVITTFATLKAPGPRFYGASRHGIFLEIAEDLEDYILATRGLYSISRTQAAEWTTYYVRETLDMVRDLAMARKAVSRIARNPAVYPEITGDLRGILAFYEVALAMGHAVSRYPRNRVHWIYMETQEIKLEGKLKISPHHGISHNIHRPFLLCRRQVSQGKRFSCRQVQEKHYGSDRQELEA